MENPNDGRGPRDPGAYAGPQLPPTQAITLWHGGQQYAASVLQPHSELVPDPYNNDTAPFYSPPATFMPPESPNVPGPVLPSQLRPYSMHMQTSRSSQDNEFGGMDLPNVHVYDQGPGPVVTNPAEANNGRSEALNGVEQSTGIALRTSGAYGNQQNTSIDLAQYGIGVDPFPAYHEGHPNRLQRNTFPNLANEQHLRDWSNSVIDDRWIVGSDEPWLLPSRRGTRMTIQERLSITGRRLSEMFSTGTTRYSSFNMDSLIGSFPDPAHAPVGPRRVVPRVRGTGSSDEYDTLAGYARLAGTDNNTSGARSDTQGGEAVREVEPGKRVHPPGAIGDGRKKPSGVVGNGKNGLSSSSTVEGGRSGQNQSTANHEKGEPSSAASARMTSAQYIASIFTPVKPDEHDKTDVSIDGVRIRQADLTRYIEQKREEGKLKDTQQNQEQEMKSARGYGTLSSPHYRRSVSNLRGILQSVSEEPENEEQSTTDMFQGSASAVVGSGGSSGAFRSEMRERDLSERANQDTFSEQSKQPAEDAAAAEQQPQITHGMPTATLDDVNANLTSTSHHRQALSGTSLAFNSRGLSNQPPTLQPMSSQPMSSQPMSSQPQALALDTMAGMRQPEARAPNIDSGSNMSLDTQQLNHFIRGANGQLHLLSCSNQNHQQAYVQNTQQAYNQNLQQTAVHNPQQSHVTNSQQPHVLNPAQGVSQHGQSSMWSPFAANYQAVGLQSPASLLGVQHQQLVANRHGGYTPLIPPGLEGLAGRYTDQRRLGGISNVAPNQLPSYSTPFTQQGSASSTPAIHAPRPSNTTRAAVLGNTGTRPTSRASSYQPLASPALGGPVVNNMELSNSFGGTVGQPSAARALPLLPYRPGSDATYPHPAAEPSVGLQRLIRDGQPTGEMAMRPENLPLGEVARDTQPAEWGVVKIGNIPYSITKAEVHAFLGGNAKVLTPNLGEAIHIIMDRSSGKTMDCYVEFSSFQDAQTVVNKLHRHRGEGNRYLKLHNRNVQVETSSQAILMKELFPKAKNVQWNGQVPMVIHTNEPYNSGFKAFLTMEELVLMVKHVEQPQRSPYTQKCPQRAYECLISTLYKFPWHATHLYTLLTRNQLYSATRDMVTQLLYALKHGGGPGLSATLLSQLLIAGLNAYGFSERQKHELKGLVDDAILGPLNGLAGGVAAVRMSPLMKWWPWEVLGRKTDVQEDVVLFYAYILSLSCSATLDRSSYHTGDPSASSQLALTGNPFGAVTVPWPQDSTGQVPAGTMCTMQQAAAIEWKVLRECVFKVLGNGGMDHDDNNDAEDDNGGVSLLDYEAFYGGAW